MRTTLNLDEELLVRLKEIAARSGQTLTAVIGDSLRESLARRERQPLRAQVVIPTFRGRGLQPGVDLDSSASLLELWT